MKFQSVVSIFFGPLLFAALALCTSGVSPFDSPEFCSQIITPSCNTTFSYIDALNAEIRPFVKQLVQTPYFRYFKLNFDKQCKFWNAEHFCASENCAVEILPPSQYNWSEVSNESLKPSKLGGINYAETTGALAVSQNKEGTCEDLDYCEIDDDHHCVYVNLANNPERFTGYGGNQSFEVWKAIYSENCFPNTNPMSMTDLNANPEECIEKVVFYRLVSGMHASIAVHLSNEYLCSSTGEFYPDLKVFMERVGKFNDRLSNIYFNYALVTQAILELSKQIPLIETIEKRNNTSNQRDDLLSSSTSVEDYESILNPILKELELNTLFDTSGFFNAENSAELKKDFRARFRNVSAIMDCVGCDRCRMWGKVQTIGYGTALKILFESNNEVKPTFRRIELVALINTLDRLSKSIEAINNFKKMYVEYMDKVWKGEAKPGQYEVINKGGLDFPFVPSVLKKPQAISETKESELPEWQKFRSASRKVNKPTGFKDELKIAFEDVYDALTFVLKSYRDLPFTLYRYSVVRLDEWWKAFIGMPHSYRYYDDENLQSIDLNEVS